MLSSVDWQQLFFVVYFSHRRSAPIKKPKSTGAPKNLWVDPFPDPIGHFGVPWQPFLIFGVLIEGIIESENLTLSLLEGPITLGWISYQALLAIWGLPFSI